ncbi:hypothetical protein [Marinoscillum furvescens]|nr:hypothetical protein [Marinoscillum furvescens]
MKIQLTPDQLKVLSAAAERVGLKLNEYITRIIVEHLEKRFD